MSSKTRCKKQVKEYLGDKVSKEFVDYVIDELDKVRTQAKKTGQSSKKFEQIRLEKIRRAIEDRQALAALSLKRRAKNSAFYRDFAGGATGSRRGKLMQEALISRLSDTYINRSGAGLSVERIGKKYLRDYQIMLEEGLKNQGILDFAKSGTLEKEIAIEMFELQTFGKSGKSGNKNALAIAKVFNSVQNKMIDDLNTAGFPMRKLDGYIAKQTHDPIKILALDTDPTKAKRIWSEKMLPKLDQNRMFEPDQNLEARLNVLDDIADTFINGKNKTADHLDGATDQVVTLKNFSEVGTGLLKERVLHFKSGEDFFEYNQEFGFNSIFDSVVQSMFTNSRSTAAIEVFGPNPRATVSGEISRIQKSLRKDPEALSKFNEKVNDIRNKVLPEVMGFDYTTPNQLLSKAQSFVRTLNNITKLGGASLISVTDMATSASAISNATGKSYLTAFSGQVFDVLAQVNPKYKAQLNDSLQVYYDSNIAMNFNRHDAGNMGDFIPGWANKVQHYSFMFSGLNWITNTNRNAAALGFSRLISQDAGLKFDALNPSTQQTLRQFDISADDWDVMRTSLSDVEGRSFIFSEAIEDPKIANKYQILLNSISELGSPEPTARSRSRITNGLSADTKEGALFRIIGQFKSFPLFMHDVMLKTAASDPNKDFVELKDLFGSNNQANYKALSQLILGTTAMAYVGMSLRAASKNEKPPDPRELETWKEAFIKGGASGLMGDILLNDHAKYGGGLINTLAGPTAGSIDEGFGLYQDALKGDLKAKKTFDYILKNTTPNTFYLKTGLDYLILDSMREAMEPGYKAKKRRRQMKDKRDKLF